MIYQQWVRAIRLVSLVALSFSATSCATEHAIEHEAVGTAVLALGEVPAEVRCIRIDVRSASRSLSQRFTVSAGTTASLTMNSLPTGELQFSGDAFTNQCDTVDDAADGPWQSEPVTARLEPGQTIMVQLTMRRTGTGLVVVRFEDADLTCTAPAVRCNDVCVDVGADPQNCGRCGNVCTGGASCTSGECACPTPSTVCNGECVSLSTDPNNCGSCGTGCGNGLLCVNGQCSCPSGQRLCAGQCIQTNDNDNNCGMCGLVCGGETHCVSGVCSCPDDLTLCNGRCTLLDSDPRNCGHCGQRCPSAWSCEGGTCVSNLP